MAADDDHIRHALGYRKGYSIPVFMQTLLPETYWFSHFTESGNVGSLQRKTVSTAPAIAENATTEVRSLESFIWTYRQNQ